MKLSKYQIAILLGIAIVGLISYIDTSGTILLGYNDYTSGNFPIQFWFAYRNIAFLLMAIVPLSYYFLFKKDKSETLAIFATSFILFWTGLADILYFVLQGRMIPQELPWLNNHIIIGKIADLLGMETVTSFALILSVALGGGLVYLITKWLKKI